MLVHIGLLYFVEKLKLFISVVLVLSMFLNKIRIQASNSIVCGYFCNGFIDFMLAGKKLTDFTSLFSFYDFEKKWQYNFEIFQRWVQLHWVIPIECNSVKTIGRTNLTNQTKFRLNEISKIKKYFNKEVNQRKSCSKKLS